jgi:hypothetical protein
MSASSHCATSTPLFVCRCHAPFNRPLPLVSQYRLPYPCPTTYGPGSRSVVANIWSPLAPIFIFILQRHLHYLLTLRLIPNPHVMISRLLMMSRFFLYLRVVVLHKCIEGDANFTLRTRSRIAAFVDKDIQFVSTGSRPRSCELSAAHRVAVSLWNG